MMPCTHKAQQSEQVHDKGDQMRHGRVEPGARHKAENKALKVMRCFLEHMTTRFVCVGIGHEGTCEIK